MWELILIYLAGIFTIPVLVMLLVFIERVRKPVWNFCKALRYFGLLVRCVDCRKVCWAYGSRVDFIGITESGAEYVNKNPREWKLYCKSCWRVHYEEYEAERRQRRRFPDQIFEDK